MTTTFSKVLVARYNPRNQCFARDNDVLAVTPLSPVPPRDHVGHHFVSANDTSLVSKYGWVKVTTPFSIDDFVAQNLKGKGLSEEERRHLETMFVAIAKLPSDTPVTATYSARGVERKRMEFTVHRVFFHDK